MKLRDISIKKRGEAFLEATGRHALLFIIVLFVVTLGIAGLVVARVAFLEKNLAMSVANSTMGIKKDAFENLIKKLQELEKQRAATDQTPVSDIFVR